MKTPEEQQRVVLTGCREGAILLVEDSPQVREVCRATLRRAGYEVIEASTPTEGLSQFEENADTIDLIVSDLVMPVMRGTEMVARIHEKHPDVPVLYMSGYAPEDASGGELTEQDLLAKPFSPSQLLTRVRRSLGTLDSVVPHPDSER